MRPDFSGYATKYNVKCSDGRTISPNAFKHMDKARIPLVWQHQHDDPENVLGHAVLEHREDGVYAYGYFNDTPAGQNAKKLVEHKDITALSIYANQLVEKSKQVLHGAIREVSLVLAGANIGAFIDNVNIAHSDGSIVQLDDEAIIFSGEELQHEDADDEDADDENGSEGDKSIKEIYDSMTDEQKNVVAAMVGKALEEGMSGENGDGGSDNNGDAEHSGTKNDNIQHSQEDQYMSRNVFDQNGATGTLQHAERPRLTPELLRSIVEDAKKIGSFKEAFLAHAEEITAQYGIQNIDLLFPDAKAISNTPELISRRQEWVNGVINGAKKSPFSRIKSLSADITHDEARAKGYIKGNFKKEEFFSLQKRVTTPTTIYKKQKLDRDDIVDITDLDVVAWLKGEMRLMLDEELARAILVGDGREVDDEDKIKEPSGTEGAGIRSIAHDDDFYAHKVTVSSNVSGEALIEAILRARPKYRGSGNPTMYTTEDVLTDLILLKDRVGRRLYPTQAELESALRVSRIVTVPVMEGVTVNGGELLAILVNMSDYTLGADRGGAVSMFDDFDIDYNQYKYLIETRCSGALTKFKSAIVVSRNGGTLVTAVEPTFDAETGVVTIPTVTGVTYTNAETGATLSPGAQPALDPGEALYVEAVANTGYYFAHNTDNDWAFERPVA